MVIISAQKHPALAMSHAFRGKLREPTLRSAQIQSKLRVVGSAGHKDTDKLFFFFCLNVRTMLYYGLA